MHGWHAVIARANNLLVDYVDFRRNALDRQQDEPRRYTMSTATLNALARTTWIWYQDRTQAEVTPGYHMLSSAGVTALLALLHHHKNLNA